MPFTAI